jgi:hypothetical protein
VAHGVAELRGIAGELIHCSVIGSQCVVLAGAL